MNELKVNAAEWYFYKKDSKSLCKQYLLNENQVHNVKARIMNGASLDDALYAARKYITN